MKTKEKNMLKRLNVRWRSNSEIIEKPGKMLFYSLRTKVSFKNNLNYMIMVHSIKTFLETPDSLINERKPLLIIWYAILSSLFSHTLTYSYCFNLIPRAFLVVNSLLYHHS